MRTGTPERLRPWDAIKTYRYLRIGMIGAVVLLAASILIERGIVGCWQTSVSAYYYTPVKSVFVGTMIAVGLALIVYKGRSPAEDMSLNLAGMFAPVVAVAPTTNVGETCLTDVPRRFPLDDDGELAAWVVADIENNVNALLGAGLFGLVVAAFIAIAVNRSVRAPFREGERGTRVSLAVTTALLLAGWALVYLWDDFYTEAHGYAAILMFVFLIAAITASAFARRAEPGGVWFRAYLAVAVLMVAGGILIPVTGVFGEHTVFALEAYEITLFGAYWIAQTIEYWNERVEDPAARAADGSG